MNYLWIDYGNAFNLNFFHELLVYVFNFVNLIVLTSQQSFRTIKAFNDKVFGLFNSIKILIE